MSIVRVGTNKKFAEGWDAIFGKKKSSAKKATRAATKRGKKRPKRKR